MGFGALSLLFVGQADPVQDLCICFEQWLAHADISRIVAGFPVALHRFLGLPGFHQGTAPGNKGVHVQGPDTLVHFPWEEVASFQQC